MNANFQRALLEATRLTRAGDVQAATALIQTALNAQGAAPPAAAPVTPAWPRADVIDVQARVVEGAAPAAPTGQASAAPAAAPAQEPQASETEAADAQRAQRGRPVRGAARKLAGRALSALKSIAPAMEGLAEPLHMPVPQQVPDGEPYGPGEGRFVHGSHTEGGSTRAYKLFVPPARHGGGLPLVVMLHGCTQHPDDFAAGTGMNEAAREQGFYVLYPAQSTQMNPQRCWNWFKHSHQARGRGEAALLTGMARAVVREHGLDAQRVYVAGLSAGGAMAAVLGAAYPDVFAAVGVHSGLPAGVAHDLPTALAAMQGHGQAATAAAPAAPPTIVFHGDRDATVHPVNGEQALAGCAGTQGAAQVERGRSRGGREYTRRTWRNAGGQTVAEHWSVHGAGHAWAGGRREGSYTDAQGPDATDAMLRFFLAHRLRRGG